MGERQQIVCVNGHYEAYDGGIFVCSGDTYKECLDELIQILAEDAKLQAEVENRKSVVVA